MLYVVDARAQRLVVEALSRHLSDQFGVERTRLGATTTFDELGFSSLEVIEILVSFQEAAFATLGRADETVSLPSEAPPLETLRDLAALLLSTGWLTHEEIELLNPDVQP